MLDDVKLANGLAWNHDGDALFFVDSLRHQVTRHPFDAADGTLGEGTVFLRIDPDEGMPDGIAMDTEGGLWVALAGGSAVRRYTDTGALDEVVALPVEYPTSCAFGGPALRDLYITSGTRPIAADERPAAVARGAGALFRLPVGVAGLPTERMVL